MLVGVGDVDRGGVLVLVAVHDHDLFDGAVLPEEVLGLDFLVAHRARDPDAIDHPPVQHPQI